MSHPVCGTSLLRGVCLLASILVLSAFPVPRADGRAAEDDRRTVEAPQVLYSKLDPAEVPDPIWVAASELVEGDSRPDWKLLGRHAAETWASRESTLQERVSLKGQVVDVPEEDCEVMHNRLTWASSAQRPGDSVVTFVKSTKHVFAGTVVAHTAGFYMGSLATVLTVEVSEILRGLPESEAEPYLYVVYPHARFALNGRVYCAQHQVGPGLPPIGSKLMVLTHHGPADEQGLLFKVSVDEILGVNPEGALLVPEGLETETTLAKATSWEDLLYTIRSLLSPGSGEPELSEKERRR